MGLIPHGELGWLRALSHKGGGPEFEPPGGTGDLPGCSTPGPRGISRGARKLARTSTVIKKKKKKKNVGLLSQWKRIRESVKFGFLFWEFHFESKVSHFPLFILPIPCTIWNQRPFLTTQVIK